ncbi:MAG: hypothetical protein ABIF19_11075 [Planctomycetota bacterium]
MAVKVRLFEGKKFVWDSEEYENKAKADEAEKKYRANGFEVESCSEDGKVRLYSRRAVTEVVVDQG